MKNRQQKKNVIHPVTDEKQKTQRFFICTFLIVATLAIYWQVQNHEFLNFDDKLYVAENPNIQSGLTFENMVWALTESYAANWHPVTWVSHTLDLELYGLDPSGHHMTSLLIHIANTLLLFGVLMKMTGALWRSAMVAALFALHPINVESVAWIAERKNVLSTFFWFLTMWAYASYAKTPRVGVYLLVVLFLTLGLMAKPMLVTLPFVLILLDFWPLKRWGWEDMHTQEIKKLILEKIPLFALVVGASITTFVVQQSGDAVKSTELFSLYTRTSNALVSYLKYLGKMVWPQGLSVFYPHPGNSLSIWKALVCGLVLVGFTTWVVRRCRKRPYLAVGWFWYLGTLVPVIGIVQVGEQAMADRYMYIPLIGIFIAIVWGVSGWIKNGQQKLLLAFAGVSIFLLMVTTSAQVALWKNSITLFEHAISVTEMKSPHFTTVHNNLGNAYANEKRYEDAAIQYRQAIKIDPQYATAHNNLGQNLHRLKMYDEAIKHYQQAIRIKTNYAKAYNNFANTLAEQGNMEEALTYARKCVSIKPKYVYGIVTLGKILEELGELNEAKAYYMRALELDQNSFRNNLNYANVLNKMKKMAKAIPYYKKTIALKPSLMEAHYNLGNALGQEGQLDEAQRSFEKAITLDVKQPLPHYGLGIIYQRQGKNAKAIGELKQALLLNPNLKQAHHFLGEIYYEMGQEQKSIFHMKSAEKISEQKG